MVYPKVLYSTGPIGYSDSAGKPKKCHFFVIVTLSDDFQFKKDKKLTLAHFSRFATLTGVIVTDRTCSTPYFLGYSFGRVGPLLLRFAKGAQTEREGERGTGPIGYSDTG